MPNHLVDENSPYLLQHASNPVDWYPWGEAALSRARREAKPIFLSIGYAACHWCHVMAHESFEDPATAALMNEHFINIKVDREERPDLDSIYMSAVVAMTGQGGWPMSVFLTPDLQPFYGGTYFPPARRYNMPSFREVLLAVARLWREDRPRLLESSLKLAEHLRSGTEITSLDNKQAAPSLGDEVIIQAAQELAKDYDWKNGGWGKAPKFPQPMAIEFLLRKATRSDAFARDIAVHALKSMAKGGMYDVVGGGFARYSTDDLWRIPHFEKMLYDNAQLALVYLHGWLITKESHFRRVCEETLDFVLREMTHSQGGFYASLDADSEGEEGKFYAWTLQEIRKALDDLQDAALFIAAYAITEAGNFEGKTVLQRAMDDAQLAARFDLPVDAIPDRLDTLHKRLLDVRTQRVRPATDDKIICAWNALALIAFAEAARYLERDDYLAAAQRNARFLLDHLIVEGRLLRSWRVGQAKHNAYLEDYAALVLGLLALYQSDPNPEWYKAATGLANEMLAHFTDADGGFFDTRDDHETLLLRPKDLQDNATPSGSALAACALLQLAAFEGRSNWNRLAQVMLAEIQDFMVRHPSAFAQWLQAADFALGPVYEVAIIGEAGSSLTQELLRTLWGTYRPRQVTAMTTFPPDSGAPALLRERSMIQGRTTAYVCQGFACLRPTCSPEIFSDQLDGKTLV